MSVSTKNQTPISAKNQTSMSTKNQTPISTKSQTPPPTKNQTVGDAIFDIDDKRLRYVWNALADVLRTPDEYGGEELSDCDEELMAYSSESEDSEEEVIAHQSNKKEKENDSIHPKHLIEKLSVIGPICAERIKYAKSKTRIARTNRTRLSTQAIEREKRRLKRHIDKRARYVRQRGKGPRGRKNARRLKYMKEFERFSDVHARTLESVELWGVRMS